MFNPDDLIWADFEVYGGLLDLKAAGTFRYVAEASTRAIVLAYAIGSAPALTWHADGAILDWDNAPGDLCCVERELRRRRLEFRHAWISLPHARARHRSDDSGRRFQLADRS